MGDSGDQLNWPENKATGVLRGQSPGNIRKADEARTGWMRQELRMERPGLAGSLPLDGNKEQIFLLLTFLILRVMEEYGEKLNRRHLDSGLLI